MSILDQLFVPAKPESEAAAREDTGSDPKDWRRVLFSWHMVGNRFLALLSNMIRDIPQVVSLLPSQSSHLSDLPMRKIFV